jgi:hypothetical protein
MIFFNWVDTAQRWHMAGAAMFKIADIGMLPDHEEEQIQH